ncbi:MAG: hypothetical protein DCC58_18200 [Chloroflexi bacterium]|nr:MAG: hypothetical protein DCC58_18200 [Chloroflexota bacterium]
MRTNTALHLGIAAGAALLLAVALPAAGGASPALTTSDLLVAIALVVLLGCTQLLPIERTTERIALQGGLVFCLVLLVVPSLAVLLALAGILPVLAWEQHRAGRAQRPPAPYAPATLAYVAMQAALGGMIVTFGGWQHGGPHNLSVSALVALALAAVTIWLIGSLAPSLSLVLSAGLPTRQILWQVSPSGLLATLPALGLGFAAALLAESRPWVLPLVALAGLGWLRALELFALRRSSDTFLEALADIVDSRDRHTIEHSRRVAGYAERIASELGLARNDVALVARAARVHDIGNMSIEPAMLVRDEPLTGEEWRAVKRHPGIGSNLLLRFPRYAAAAPLVRHHHERVDGSGYPDGLHGEHIPMGARIIAVADALDAMASARPYRPALPADVIRSEFALQRNRQWDGDVVDALLRLVERGEITLPGEERLHRYVVQAALEDQQETTPRQPLGSAPERSALEAQLMYQVFHDPLTNLPNRALFMDRLEHALARIRRSSDSVAVIFVDLDNFKTINDTWGHRAGDQVLIEIARRMEACVRPGDTVARLAGDELTLLVENIQSLDDALVVVERVAQALARPIPLEQESVQVSASMGVAFSPAGRETALEVLHHADTAMYRAKKDGKAGYAIYEPGMRHDAADMVELKQDIVLAIERGELTVHYQPKALLDSGRIAGMEALVRWHHPERGLILPAEFLPAAGHTGIVTEIDRYVLRDAVRQVVAWRMAQAAGPPLVVSVNISARTFANPHLANELAALLNEFRLDPRGLMLEVTEDVAMAEPDAAIERFTVLNRLGIQLAIDNFGAGSSSLSYLKRFPIDVLKIARPFVDGLGYDPGDTAVVRAIIAFASTLRRSVAAEGIETAEQFFQLRGLGCEQGQGNHLAPPLSRETISALVAGSATLPLGRAGRGALLAPAPFGERPITSAQTYARRISEATS